MGYFSDNAIVSGHHRNPKSEKNPNDQMTKWNATTTVINFAGDHVIRIFDFGFFSDFWFRFSDFPYPGRYCCC